MGAAVDGQRRGVVAAVEDLYRDGVRVSHEAAGLLELVVASLGVGGEQPDARLAGDGGEQGVAQHARRHGIDRCVAIRRGGAEVVEEAEAVVRGAGLTPGVVTLRALGACALLGPDRRNGVAGIHNRPGPADTPEVSSGDPEADDDRSRALIVDVAPNSVELSLVTDGALTLTRAADVYDSDDLLTAIVTELRRTWMSYRVAHHATSLSEVVVLGEKAIAGEVAEAAREMLNVPARALLRHSEIVDVEESDWALAGAVLASQDHETPIIDLAHPRRTPDYAGRRRRRLLAVAGIAVVGLLGLFTINNVALQRIESRTKSAENDLASMRTEYARFGRDMARLEHLRIIDDGGVQWLDHLAMLETFLPASGPLILERWAGTLESGPVRYDKDADDKWSLTRRVSIIVDGEADQRMTADTLRERLVTAEVYRVSSSGADAAGGRRLPIGFTYHLDTDVLAPVTAESARTPSEAAP